MTNCFKKHWFLIIGILLFSNYSFGQTFLSIPDTIVKPNGRPFVVRLNPTSSIAQECTSQTIKLNIGSLVYLPGSNGPLPAGVTITPLTVSGLTELTISGIVNDGKQGSSLLMDVAMQFKPGTCDNVEQEITATTINVGCNVPSTQSGSAKVISGTPNNAEIKLVLDTYLYNGKVCPRKILKYRLIVSNNGNQGFNISNAKVNLELDKCAAVLGIYKNSTYVSVDPTIITGDVQKVVFSTPDLILGPYTYTTTYDLFITYPCLSGGNNDCASGGKEIKAYLTGTQTNCGVNMTSITNTISTLLTTTGCGDVTCKGGTVGELDSIYSQLGYAFPCPSCLRGDPSAIIYVNIPPLLPNYPNRVYTVDIPVGFNVQSASVYGLTACDTPYVIKYIDGQGNKSSIPFAGSITRSVEFSTDCTISTPSTGFGIQLKYDEEALPAPNQTMIFNVKFTSDGKVIYERSNYEEIDDCSPWLIVYNQIRKASQGLYENNFNASAVPGELMTYRFQLSNQGTADSNNIVNIKLDDKFEYAGGFRYVYSDFQPYSSGQFQYLSGQPSFFVNGFGTVNVSTPVFGQPGTVSLSNFNFPCTNKALFIEFDFKVKDNVLVDTKIPVTTTIYGSEISTQPQPNIVTISAFTYVKSQMFAKCALASEWKESNINVKNGEIVDFKMQFTNKGSTPVVLSELVNLKPQLGDLFEFGSNPRNSTLSIDFNCEMPTIFTSSGLSPIVNFKYAQNSVTMNRDMLCPPQSSGNTPNWTSVCENANWLKASFSDNFTLMPGDFVDVIYKGKITGTEGTAFNSFAFKVGNCDVLSTNSNTLSIVNDSTGIGCNSCTLTNPYSTDMKNLFENLMKNILTRKINGETDASIQGSNPAELIALKPYITNGGGDKIYNFVSTVNAKNKITSISFSFTADSNKDISFFEEMGVNYNPEIGFVDQSYLRIDTTLFSSTSEFLTTCRKTLDSNGTIISDCISNTKVRYIDFCPTKFCYPMSGEIKVGD